MSSSSASPFLLRAALFDIDGTLTDSDHYHRLIFKEMLAEHGIDCDDAYFNRHISGKNNDLLGPFLFPSWSPDRQKEWFIKKEENFRERAKHDLKPLAGLLELLNYLKNNNILLAAVTNAPKINAEFLLEVLAVKEYFQEIIIGDKIKELVTKEGGNREEEGGRIIKDGKMNCFGTLVDCAPKPSPFPYYYAMMKLNVTPNQCIIFEDSPPGVTAGSKTGASVIGIMTSQKAGGLKAYGAKYEIDDFTKLILNERLLKLENFIEQETK